MFKSPIKYYRRPRITITLFVALLALCSATPQEARASSTSRQKAKRFCRKVLRTDLSLSAGQRRFRRRTCIKRFLTRLAVASKVAVVQRPVTTQETPSPPAGPVPADLSVEFVNSNHVNRFKDTTVGFEVNVSRLVESAVFSFGDGSVYTAKGPAMAFVAKHVYGGSGTYRAQVHVNYKEQHASGSMMVRVEDTVLSVNAGGPYSGMLNTPMSFHGSAEGAVNYYWDFGDGNRASGQSPKHTYSEAGAFKVTVRVEDGEGRTASATTVANVNYYGADPNFKVLLPRGTKQIFVSSVAEIDAATRHVGPGDAIVVKPGTYRFPVGIYSWRAENSGTKERRVFFVAEEPGTAIFSGDRTWYFFAEHLTVSGFTFEGVSAGSVRMRGNHQRFTGNRFAQGLGHLGIYADYAEVDNNVWEEISGGVNLWVAQPSFDCTTCDYNQFHHIHHNTWRNIARNQANGGEAMMLGYGHWKYPDEYDNALYVTAEWNYLVNADGDGETISVKSDRNAITNNCFRNNGTSGLTIRMGSTNLISRNQLWGVRRQAVRISGDDNVIADNFFDGTPNNGSAAIELHNGGSTSLNPYGSYLYIDSTGNYVSGNVLNSFRYLARDLQVVGAYFMGYNHDTTLSNNRVYHNGTALYLLQAGRSAEEFEASLNLFGNEFLDGPEPAGIQPCYTQVFAE